MKQHLGLLAISVAISLAALSATTAARAEVTAEVLKSISIPDTVETTIGKLEFFDGVPTEDTIDFSYFENLNPVIQEEPIEAINPEAITKRAYTYGL